MSFVVWPFIVLQLGSAAQRPATLRCDDASPAVAVEGRDDHVCGYGHDEDAGDGGLGGEEDGDGGDEGGSWELHLDFLALMRD